MEALLAVAVYLTGAATVLGVAVWSAGRREAARIGSIDIERLDTVRRDAAEDWAGTAAMWPIALPLAAAVAVWRRMTVSKVERRAREAAEDGR